MKNLLVACLVFTVFIVCVKVDPTSDLSNSLATLLKNRNLMGLTVEVSNNSEIIYKGNFGSKDNKNPIKNSTMFRVASLSKSFSSVAIMQLK